MKRSRTLLAVCLISALCLAALSGCSSKRDSGYRVIAELNSEEFCIAFRRDDPLCQVVTAALQEIAAEGQLARLSTQYLGADYSCLEGVPGALKTLEVDIPQDRVFLIGIQDGTAPLSSSRDDGTYTGLIPDLVQLVAEKLGWEYKFMPISSSNVDVELGSGNVDCAWLGASLDSGSESYSLTPGWLKNSMSWWCATAAGYTRMNSLKGKILGITDDTAMAALEESGLYEKAGAVWYYDDLQLCFAALAAGDCDGIVIDSIVAGYYIM